MTSMMPFGCCGFDPSVVLGAAKGLDDARLAGNETARRESRRTDRNAWYRSSVVWLAAALFVAILAACVVTIVIALSQPSDALPDVGETVFRVPLGVMIVGR